MNRFILELVPQPTTKAGVQSKGVLMPTGYYTRKPTHKQKVALMVNLCGPLGLGANYRKTAEVLGITTNSLSRRFRCLRRWYPEAWENYKSIMRVMRRQRESLENPAQISWIKNDRLGRRIREKF